MGAGSSWAWGGGCFAVAEATSLPLGGCACPLPCLSGAPAPNRLLSGHCCAKGKRTQRDLVPPAAQELIEGLTQLFEELDVNASGSVSMDELVTGLDKLGYDIRIEGGFWVLCRVPGMECALWVIEVLTSWDSWDPHQGVCKHTYPGVLGTGGWAHHTFPGCPAQLHKLRTAPVSPPSDALLRLPCSPPKSPLQRWST